MHVLKYSLPEHTGRWSVHMPKGAQVLRVAEQQGQLQLWALVDPAQPWVARTFQVVWTGYHEEVPPTAKYIGTEIVPGMQPLVLHVFEVE